MVTSRVDGVKGTPRAHDEARHVLGRRELREPSIERPRGQRLLVVESGGQSDLSRPVVQRKVGLDEQLGDGLGRTSSRLIILGDSLQ